MNVLSRPFVAAVCSLVVLLAGMPALGQKFIPTEIVEAEVITPEMNERIMIVVDQPMFDLSRDEPKPEDVTEARKQLQQLFRANQPTVAYLEALSAAIESRMEEAVKHDSAMVRMNAMIVLTYMVDNGSKKWIDAGLKDKNDAVKRWAVEALGNRMRWWNGRAAAGVRGAGAKIDAAIKQVVSIVDQDNPPHPVVVSPALEALVKVDTTKSRAALIDLLNKRVALHKADPDLSYSPERAAIESFSGLLQYETPVDNQSIKGLSRAMARYSALIVDQRQANSIEEEWQEGADTMLFQCLQSMPNLCAAAKAPKPAPADHDQVRGWIANERWEQLKAMIETDWTAILTAKPFNLKPADLKP